jgi:protein TonB
MTSLTFDNFPAPTRPTRRVVRNALPALPAVPLPPIGPVARQRRERFSTLALVGAIACLHAGAIATFAGAARPVGAPPHPVAVVIALAPPPPEPLPAPPPKASVLAPRLKTVAPPRPALAQQQHARAAVDTVPFAPAATDNAAALVAQPASVATATPAPAAAPPADERVSEPRGYAGYLRNPAPDYPPAAQRRGLEGQVVLKVHVLASGQPDSVTVAKSSGHAVLDEAAIKAVVSWAFAPARRGQAPIDGWVQVPLTFKI